ncbi:MAG: glycosyltransferase [Chloroflexi bacterium]|nr:glycosyltransferase [Chloroflexota bacterium]
MHLAVITNYYPDRRPLSEYGYHLIRGLKEARPSYKVTVLASSPGPDGVCRPWSYGKPYLPLQVMSALNSLKPDVVLINCLFTSWGNTHIANLLGFMVIPFLARKWFTIALVHHLPQTIRINATGYSMTPLHKVGVEAACAALARAQRVCFILERDRQFFARRYRHRQTSTVEHGLLGELSWAPLLQGAPTFLCLGKWGRSKDPEPVIKAVLRVAQGRLIVGGQSHPRSEGFLERVMARYSSDRVFFPGYIREEEIATFFHQGHVVVLPCRENTGTSGVAFQACQHGRALVAKDTPVFREIAQKFGLEMHFYTSDEDLPGVIQNLVDDRARLEAEGAHNMKAVEHLQMHRVAESYWKLLEDRHG